MSRFTDWRPTGETFHLLHHAWDVDEAKRILLARRTPPRTGTVQVADLASMLQREWTEQDGTVKINMGVHVDWALAREGAVDLEVPVLLAWTRPLGTVKKRSHLLMIDGWTRLAKATLVGVQTLPAVSLTQAESRRTWL